MYLYCFFSWIIHENRNGRIHKSRINSSNTIQFWKRLQSVFSIWRKLTMKLLKNGRNVLIWMGVQFADDDDFGVSWQKRFAQKAFYVSFIIIITAIAALHVNSLLTLGLINAELFFFIFLQFIMTMHGITAFMTIYLFGSHISIVIQRLTEIHKKCKWNENALNEKYIESLIQKFFPQRSWWTIKDD